MFKFKKVKYVRVTKNGLVIKYSGESNEDLLVSNGEKVDLQDFSRKQEAYWLPGRLATIERSKTWEERHNRYLKFFKNK